MATATDRKGEIKMYFHTVNEIKRLAADVGYHWFEPATMRWFGSRVGSKVYGGQYFVSSEQYDDTQPRLYTIRKVEYADGRMEIDTVGEFQQYATRQDAEKAIKQLTNNTKG